MNRTHRWQWVCAAGLGLALVSLTGCQTNIAGMTLPTSKYLRHPPQYFAPSPAFPLQRELASMEAQAAQQGIPIGPGIPPPVAPAPLVTPPGAPAPIQPPAGAAPIPAPAPAPAPAP